MFGYKVEINQYCTHSEYSNEQFGSWSVSYDNTFQHIRKKKGNEEYPDIVSSIDFAPGDQVYVVWLEYSTGDSFGHSYRGRVEPIAVFNNYKDAESLKKLIEKPEFKENDLDKGIYIQLITFESLDGQTLDIGASPWTGYFETLEEVHIEPTTMHHASK